jgi:magnesium-protoporphyrin IX monomethyl ester (oxidative) cyclase
MRVLLVHPSALAHSEFFLRLEPLGLERGAGAAREAGHEGRVVDLQVPSRGTLRGEVRSFRPEALGISLNYLAHIPETGELAAEAKRAVPDCFVFLGGHSVSFVAETCWNRPRGGGRGGTRRGRTRDRAAAWIRPGTRNTPGWYGSSHRRRRRSCTSR